jgi:hypothetical protein
MNGAFGMIIGWIYPALAIALIVLSAKRNRFRGKPWLIAYLGTSLTIMLIWHIPQLLFKLNVIHDLSTFYRYWGATSPVFGLIGLGFLFPFILAISDERDADDRPEAAGGVKMYKKTEDGTFCESKGDVADIAPLFEMAHNKYQSVMNAVHSNSLTASHERELLEAVDLFTKVIELHGTRGEPYGLRGGLYMVFGQINQDRTYLDKAEADYRKALDVGGSDPSNHAIWSNSISQLKMIRKMI